MRRFFRGPKVFYKIKIFAFYTTQLLGLFILSHRLHKRGHSILYDHGFTMRDDHKFRSYLFH